MAEQIKDYDQFEGVYWQFNEKCDEDTYLLDAIVEGPKDTPYQDGIFRFLVTIPNEYPIKAAKFKLLTPICHPSTGTVYDPQPHTLCVCCEFIDHHVSYTISWYLSRFR